MSCCAIVQLIVNFRPGPEEELMQALSTLLQKSLQLSRAEYQGPVPQSMQDSLTTWFDKFFGAEARLRSPAQAAMVDALKNDFARELLPVLPLTASGGRLQAPTRNPDVCTVQCCFD